MTNAFKELTPVMYGENGIKVDYYSLSDSRMCFHAHWHDRIELLFIVSGSLDLQIDSEHFSASPGQAVIIMPSMVHCGFSGKCGVSYYVIAIDIEKFNNATIASAKYLKPIMKQTVKFQSLVEHPKVIDPISKLIDSFTEETKSNPLYAVGKTYEIISLLYEHCTISSRQPQKTDERFGMILEYVNSHFTENISANSISRIFGYDETYFCRRFKAVTGITTMNYIRILRLELAQKMLRETTESISHISLKCGFSDTHYFSNCFKKHFGISPSEFRQTY